MTREHEAMDDMADHAAQLNTREGYHRLPRGCDYQGRWPQAAEAATEVGADDEDDPHVSGALAWPVYVVLSVLAVMAAWHFSGVLARFFVGLLA